jgi:(p)ppGpp synthase/HD superfamily hydrolase
MKPDDIWLVDFAYKQAKYGHRGENREGGGRYFEHCRSTALIHIDEFGIVDPDLVVSDLIHDVPEDSWLLSIRDIEHIWNKRVARITDAVTKREGEHIVKYIERS